MYTYSPNLMAVVSSCSKILNTLHMQTKHSLVDNIRKSDLNPIKLVFHLLKQETTETKIS